MDRVAERTDTARDDRDFVHRIAAGQRERDERVPHLVVRNDLALLGVQDAGFLLESGDDGFDGAREIVHRHRRGLAPGREQRRLVDQICEIRTGETGRKRGDLLGIDVGRGLNLA